jgi:hypothetical protein
MRKDYSPLGLEKGYSGQYRGRTCSTVAFKKLYVERPTLKKQCVAISRTLTSGCKILAYFSIFREEHLKAFGGGIEDG